MISTRLRDALGAMSMLVLVGGPVMAALAFMIVAVSDDRGTGAALGRAIELFFGSLLGGGALRLLVSIDARLEARS